MKITRRKLRKLIIEHLFESTQFKIPVYNSSDYGNWNEKTQSLFRIAARGVIIVLDETSLQHTISELTNNELNELFSVIPGWEGGSSFERQPKPLIQLAEYDGADTYKSPGKTYISDRPPRIPWELCAGMIRLDNNGKKYQRQKFTTIVYCKDKNNPPDITGCSTADPVIFVDTASALILAIKDGLGGYYRWLDLITRSNFTGF